MVPELSYPSGILDFQDAHVQMGTCKKICDDAWNWEEMLFPGRQKDLHDLLFLRGDKDWVGREGCHGKMGLQLPGCACGFPAVIGVKVQAWKKRW